MCKQNDMINFRLFVRNQLILDFWQIIFDVSTPCILQVRFLHLGVTPSLSQEVFPFESEQRAMDAACTRDGTIAAFDLVDGSWKCEGSKKKGNFREIGDDWHFVQFEMCLRSYDLALFGFITHACYQLTVSLSKHTQ